MGRVTARSAATRRKAGRTPARRAGTARRRPPGHGGLGPGVVRCAVLTVSDTRRGAADRSGAAIERLIERAGHRVTLRAWSRDEIAAIRRASRSALARADVDALIVTGGTGVAPRDRTPEALADLIEKRLPGFGELFRARSHAQVGTATWLSRAEAGVARGRLVVLLPGSTAAVELAMKSVLLPELIHVVRLLGRFEGEG